MKNPLTGQQTLLILGIHSGKKMLAISADLGLAYGTAKAYQRAIEERLELKGVVALALWAERNMWRLVPKIPGEMVYIQHRGFVGNCLMWWAKGGHGYTTDLEQAWCVTEQHAAGICKSRPEQDKARPVRIVDALASRHVHCERVGVREALPWD